MTIPFAQQAVPEIEWGHFADVLDDARPSSAKRLRPRPRVLHREPRVEARERRVGLLHDLAVLERELQADDDGGRIAPPHAAAVRPELLGHRAQDVFDQPIGVGLHGERIERAPEPLHLTAR